MTGPGRDPESVIRQALRAQAGGPKRTVSAAADDSHADSGPFARFTAAQLLLLAATIGVLIGVAVGIAVILA